MKQQALTTIETKLILFSRCCFQIPWIKNIPQACNIYESEIHIM